MSQYLNFNEQDEYKIYNADCIDVLSAMDSDSIDLVVCDPPYKTYAPSTKGYQADMWKGNKSKGGFKNNELKMDDVFPLLYKVMKDECHAYLFTNEKNLIDFHLSIKKHNFNIYKTLIWNKNRKIPNNCYCSQHEYIIFFRKGKSKYISNTKSSTILNYNVVHKRFHPSQKPVELLRHLIKNSSNKGDCVLDFAMGSAATGIAALDTKRKFIGIELETRYYQYSERRLKDKLNQINNQISFNF